MVAYGRWSCSGCELESRPMTHAGGEEARTASAPSLVGGGKRSRVRRDVPLREPALHQLTVQEQHLL